MQKFLILFVCMFLSSAYGLAADYQGITMWFSANHTCKNTPLDSVLIENISQQASMTLYHPDTMATFVFTGLDDLGNTHRQLKMFQNYPNPFAYKTYHCYPTKF